MAETIAAGGWKWIEVAVNFPYGHLQGLRQLAGATVDLTDDERATREALRDEYDRLEAEYAEAEEPLDDIDQRLGEVDAALEALDSRPMVYAPSQMAKAGFEIKGHCHPASIRPDQSSLGRLSSVPLAPTSPQATQYNGTMRKPRSANETVDCPISVTGRLQNR